MKIICKYKWSVERDAGWALLDGESETDGKKRIAEKVSDKPIRPCGLHHGWVFKDYCQKKCKQGFVSAVE